MKRFFTFFFALVATTALWAEDFEVDGIYYNILYGSEVAVTYQGDDFYSYSNEYSGSVTIPKTVTNSGTTYSVTSIGDHAFEYCSDLTSITIPNSVTSIGEYAFYYCSGLTSITIGSGVTSIGGLAFEGCSGLTSITIGSGVTSIGGLAFEGCSGLTSITIPNSVTSIGGSAFEFCESLTSITIPNSVTSIGFSAFWGCSGLTSIVVEEGNTMYDSRENCNAIIETATNTLITGCQNTIIPNSLTSIEAYAFSHCDGLTSIIIPENVETIGIYAFHLCSGLTSVTIGNSVTSIGYDAFAYCSGLTSIVVEEGNTMYDSRENCNAIIETATNTLIRGCQNTIIPNSVTSIGNCAFSGCSGLTSVTIPNSVTSIGYAAFDDCSSLTSITIPNSVTSIGSSAFSGCKSLTSITIPNSVTSIGNSAFGGCSGLTEITIPNSVTSIGNYAFEDCSSLVVVNVEATTPPTLGTYAVFTSSPTCNIPCGTLDVYQASDWQNVVGEFVEQCSDDSGDDGDMDKDLTIVFSDRDNNQISAQTVTLRVPVAPEIAGFTFLYWQTITARVDDVITIQAVYGSNTPTEAPEVFVNPANPTQKLIRNGQVYILHEEKMYTISGQVVK